MRLLLPREIVERLTEALCRAGRRETGGVLMGEQIEPDLFRVAAVSVQNRTGSSARFVRDLEGAAAQLEQFFQRTGCDYARFNYLGEWHSHPGFPAVPSETDIASMKRLVEDPDVGVNFAVLMIVRGVRPSALELSATVFVPGRQSFNADLRVEGGSVPVAPEQDPPPK